jgi:hypothetical protein
MLASMLWSVNREQRAFNYKFKTIRVTPINPIDKRDRCNKKYTQKVVNIGVMCTYYIFLIEKYSTYRYMYLSIYTYIARNMPVRICL